MASNKPTRKPTDPDQSPSTASDQPGVQNDDFAKIGPLSIEGVEASDLPDEGRGPADEQINHEAGRNLPQNTGTISGDVGLRGTPQAADADKHGGRKKN